MLQKIYRKFILCWKIIILIALVVFHTCLYLWKKSKKFRSSMMPSSLFCYNRMFYLILENLKPLWDAPIFKQLRNTYFIHMMSNKCIKKNLKNSFDFQQLNIQYKIRYFNRRNNAQLLIFLCRPKINRQT